MPTITTHANQFVHPLENRYLTLSELRRCSSFPDDFKFPEGKYNEAIARLGNSVPPLLMKAIATYVITKMT